jgi:hypothetical protein
MERELSDFIKTAEDKRKTSPDLLTESTVGRRADAQSFNQPLSA